MVRKTLPALLAVFALLPAAAFGAEKAPKLAIVTGVSAGDLLNLRADASPTGRIEARLQNGDSLKAFECDTFNGYDWCAVQDIDNPKVRGWVPARYLRDAAGGEVAAFATGATQRPAGNAGPAADQGEKLALPPDLAARFGAAEQPPVSAAEAMSAANLRKAMQDAYAINPPPDDAGDVSQSILGDETDTGMAADVPVPTPRPDLGATVMARVEAPGSPAADAATQAGADIPCARYVGQPMTRCRVSVARKGADAADVTVTWPDGGTRVVSFRDGKPAASNSHGEFRFTREGTLNMIRIGPSERFEITDALTFED